MNPSSKRKVNRLNKELLIRLDINTARERVIKAARKWYDSALSDCQYGRKCTKHAGVCPLMYAVKDLISLEKLSGK